MKGRVWVVLLLALATGCALVRRTPPLTDAAPDSRAPDTFIVAFQTSKGTFEVQSVRAWAPLGVDRFHHLVRIGYYDGTRFFRVVPNFVVQFGIHGDSAVNAAWRNRRFADDSVRASNQEGYLTYAMAGPNTRTTQLFINLRDNRRLDTLGFAPIGRVVSGMDVVRQLHAGYGDGPPRGAGPSQDSIARAGNAYLARAYPQLDSIVRARLIKD